MRFWVTPRSPYLPSVLVVVGSALRLAEAFLALALLVAPDLGFASSAAEVDCIVL